jgi:hypothetical protein
MSTERQRIQEERRALKAKYARVYGAVSEVLFRHDPVGINFETNTDEYEPEVGTILPRLRTCRSADDVIRVVHEEFTRWFGEAGSISQYKQIGNEIWALWQKHGDD